VKKRLSDSFWKQVSSENRREKSGGRGRELSDEARCLVTAGKMLGTAGNRLGKVHTG